MSQRERERELRRREEQQRRQQERQAANQLATSAAQEKGAAEPGYWDIIGDPDIQRGATPEEDEHFGEFVATEMSDKFALGNLTRGDWHSWQWQIENEFFTMRNEFADADSNLSDADMAAMYGEVRPRLTNGRARRLRSAMQVKKMMASLSINARGLRSGTEIHAVARTESEEPEKEDGGILGRAKDKLV